MTGTPVRSAASRADTLSPKALSTATGGPMKTIPAASQAFGKSGFSERKP